MLKPLLLLSAVILFELAPSSGRLPQEAAPAPSPAPVVSNAKNPVKPTADSQARAKKMYSFDCMMCHGATGDGKTDLANDMKLTLADMTDPATLAGKSDGELFATIKNGKGKMPAEGDRAKSDEVWNLVLYIRGLSKDHPASAPAAAPAAAPVPAPEAEKPTQ
jgi:mono/diheme cytochrome c family protein